MSVTIDSINQASRVIAGHVVRTPCVHSRTLSTMSGADVFVKFENHQFTASFKDRGALVKIASLADEERSRGVIAMSAGNHAQAVAYHAQRQGIPATIVMPEGAPVVKVRNTER
ncbi:MAG: pyridoxal-phosphate dependent enzyme, partial [bacterium]|nr:pyridoxal-phosphate dependent enzyme [bacterium]